MPWEQSYGTWFGLMASFIVICLVIFYTVITVKGWVETTEVFYNTELTGLTHPPAGIAPKEFKLSALGTFFKDANYNYVYDERYLRVVFEQRYIYFSDSQWETHPRHKVQFNITICPEAVGNAVNTPAAICPDSSGTGIEPHIMGDYADDEYRYFQVTWRGCDNSTDTGPKRVILANKTSYYVNAPCAPSSESDALVYNSGKVNAVMPQAGGEGFGDFVRHVRFVSGVLQSMDIFVTSREEISRSRWIGGLSVEDKSSSHQQYVTNVLTYAEDRVSSSSSKDYLKYFLRVAEYGEEKEKRPVSLLDVFSRIGGLTSAMVATFGLFARWYTQRHFDAQRRHLFPIWHEMDLPKSHTESLNYDELERLVHEK